jgi:hypothetical protein
MMMALVIRMHMKQRIKRAPAPDRCQCEEKGQYEKRHIRTSKARLANSQIAENNRGQEPDHDFDGSYILFHD